MLTVPNIKEANNEELARFALNCLEELERRGNKGLRTAQREISLFHTEIIVLRGMAEELERLHDLANSLVLNIQDNSDYELDYEDKLALDD